jgi:ABC-type nickel/cobalt efflux system permease component RcnA
VFHSTYLLVNSASLMRSFLENRTEYRESERRRTMKLRSLWRFGLVVCVGFTLMAATGCGRWSWRHRHGEVKYEHDHDHPHGHAPGHVHHPHGGPPGQMKKQ